MDGAPTDRMSRRDLARLVAYVPQKPELPAEMTVADYILLGRSPHIGYFGFEKTKDHQICAGLLERLDLTQLRRRARCAPFPAANCSASSSDGPWPRRHRSSSSTNPPAPSTSVAASTRSRSSTPCASSTG